MKDTAFQARPPAKGSLTPDLAPAKPVPSLRREPRGPILTVLHFCASLRITVTLFALSLVLVFYGTWAQVDAGVWTVVRQYFRSALVWIPMHVVLLRTVDAQTVPYSIPFPGGWLLGSLLLINLLAAHAVRFRATWKRAGILLIHAGLILMMLGEVVTGVFAIEGRMSIPEGQASNYVEVDRHSELAIVDRSDPKTNVEVTVPDSLLSKGGLIQSSELPFDIEVIRYFSNSEPVDAKRLGGPNPATAGIGLTRAVLDKPETSGVDPEQRVEIASAYVTLKKKGSGELLGTYLVSTWFSFLLRPADEVTVDGKKYEIGLRAKRDYRKFTIALKQFHHDVYLGTKVPKNYQSDIRLLDPDYKEDRDVISMNDPLRYRGETFYQAGLHPLSKGTVLQVVRNPGWLMPYISCLVVTLGMLIHFGMNLVTFLRRRLA